MSDTKDHCIFKEKEYEKSRDLNAFLKSEKLGFTDNFKFSLSVQLSTMKRAYKGTIPYNLLLVSLPLMNLWA